MTSETWISLTTLFAQGAAPAAAPAGGGGSLADLLPLFLILGALLYFMVLRPESQRRNDTDQMQKELKKNDRVVTIGGIFGVITNIASEDEVTIRIDDKNDTKLRITRSAIQKVMNKESSQSKSD